MDEMKLLFDRLDWSRPELSEAKALLDHGKENDCMDALIRHFSGRTAPVYLFDREELKKCKDPGLIEDAEEVMRHKIYGYQFESDIDWMFNPTAETSRDGIRRPAEKLCQGVAGKAFYGGRGVRKKEFLLPWVRMAHYRNRDPHLYHMAPVL